MLHRLKLGIIPKVNILVVAIILVFGLGACYFLFTAANQKVYTLEKGALAEGLEYRAIEFGTFLSGIEALGTTISNDYAIQSFIIEQDSDYLNIVLKTYQDSLNISNISILNTEGTIIYSSDTSFVGVNVADRNFFKGSLVGNNHFSLNKKYTSDVSTYYFSTPIKESTSDTILGVLVLDIGTEYINHFVSSSLLMDPSLYKIFQGDISLLVADDSGIVVESSDRNLLYKSLWRDESRVANTGNIYSLENIGTINAFSKPKGDEVGVSFSDSTSVETNRKTLFSLTKVPNYPFYLASKISVNNNLYEFLYPLLVPIFIGMFLSCIAISVFMGSLLNPLVSLKTSLERFMNGAPVAYGDWKTGDEIEHLANSIRDMVLKFADSRKDLSNNQETISTFETNMSKLEKDIHDLNKFYLAVENTFDHIVLTDPEGIITYANHGVERITGFSREEIIGKKAGSKDLWGGLMPLDFYRLLWKTLKEEKKPFTGEINNKRKNGELYIADTSITPILDDEGNVLSFVGIERDITKEKEVDKMKTEFISLVSHQLKTPLAAMRWFLEILQNGEVGKLTKDQKECVMNIEHSNNRMIELVSNLLDISKLEAGKITINVLPTNVKTLIDELLVELRSLAKEKGITINFEIEKDLPELLLDPKLIRNVYMNLLTNAIKYTPEKGVVTISISTKRGTLISEVTDTGYGIPKKQQSKVFERFFRASNALAMVPDGTGLGLYLAKKIVDASGGTVGFESKENKGSTFWFHLPLKKK